MKRAKLFVVAYNMVKRRGNHEEGQEDITWRDAVSEWTMLNQNDMRSKAWTKLLSLVRQNNLLGLHS